MAIARDNFNDWFMTGANPESHAFDCMPTGNDLLLVYIVNDSSNVDRVATVTYAGIPATRIGIAQGATNISYLYGLIAPSSGSNNLTILYTSPSAGFIFAASYSNVSQTAWLSSPNFNSNTNNSTTTLTNTITVAGSGSWVGGGGSNNAAQIVVDKGLILANSQNVARANWDSNGAPGAGSYTLTWSDGGSTDEKQGIIVEIPGLSAPNKGNLITFF